MSSTAATDRSPGLHPGAPAGLPAVLEQLRERTRPLAGIAARVLPVRDDLAGLLPDGGLRRGSVVEVTARSLCFALLGRAAAEGAWAVLVGVPDAGLAATADHGLGLDRLAVVMAPPSGLAATVVAALLDAVELVVVGPTVVLGATEARRLAARARERGAVLLSLGAWPVAADVRLEVVRHRPQGLAAGHGALQGWSVEVASSGRGAAARPRRATLTLAGTPVAPGTPDPVAQAPVAQAPTPLRSVVSRAG